MDLGLVHSWKRRKKKEKNAQSFPSNFPFLISEIESQHAGSYESFLLVFLFEIGQWNGIGVKFGAGAGSAIAVAVPRMRIMDMGKSWVCIFFLLWCFWGLWSGVG